MAAATAANLSGRIGQSVLVRFESLTVECTIADAKCSYGAIRYQVKPVAGDGLQWVDTSRVLPKPDASARLYREAL